MDMNKLKPWNWFKHEDKHSAHNVPVKHPKHSLSNIHNEIDSLFNNAFENFGFPSFGKSFGGLTSNADFPLSVLKPSVDISETPENYLVTVEVPGIDEKDIQLSLHDNVLTISGEKKQESEDKNKNWHTVERSYGSFQRVLSLPANSNTEEVSAKFKNGVLTVTVGKTEGKEPEAKTIHIETL